MDQPHMVSDLVRPPSQMGAMALSQSHVRHLSNVNMADPAMRSRSETSTSSRSRPRPKSRGSTTSVQSAATNNPQHFRQEHTIVHAAVPQPAMYMAQPHPQQSYHQDPEQALMQYGQQVSQGQPYHLDSNLAGIAMHDMRPHSQQDFHSHEMQMYQVQGYPHGMPQYGMPQEPAHSQMRAQSDNFESLENQSPAPEDYEAAENGSRKKKKGSASSLANDMELRRLVTQYNGRSLQEVAAEVQTNEGGGGRSEKAKQVFAMLWLQESCRRSNESVRRDKVFSRYTERCGNERVPTLNPASFGKLVRIIFPNVQTRRLGIRGESKYHYVDLSLFPEEDEPQIQPPQHGMLSLDDHNDSNTTIETPTLTQQSQPGSASITQNPLPQAPTDTAEFPAPTSSFAPRQVAEQLQNSKHSQPSQPVSATRLDCHFHNSPLIRIPTKSMSATVASALPSLRANLPGIVSSYVALPSPASYAFSSHTNDSPVELPDIHSYLLGSTYDPSIANSLANLYRSYCIVVVDAFRFCRERNFLHHYTAFNGTMTVPVSKMLGNERLSGWIQECDMRMYKKMVRYVAPLITQIVPDEVWSLFDNVSNKLVEHIVNAFEEKCPAHVVVAKVVPAARFCHLLKKLHSANAAANHVSRMLGNEGQRLQMWVDFMSLVNPERVLEESLPPAECLRSVEGVMRNDLRRLLMLPTEDLITSREKDLGTPFADFLAAATTPEESTAGILGLVGSISEDEPAGPLDQWTQWLEHLPLAFAKHHPQCLINWHNGFWKSIITQLCVNDAQSYPVWWCLEIYLSSMLTVMTQMEGFLMNESLQREMNEIDMIKRRAEEHDEVRHMTPPDMDVTEQTKKRKRSENDIAGENRDAGLASGRTSRGSSSSSSNISSPREDAEDEEASRPQTGISTVAGLDGGVDDDMDDLQNAALLDLPSINTQSPSGRQHQAHDDSGISLDIDIEVGVSEAASASHEDHSRTLKRQWDFMSDPADAAGDVVVI